MIGTTLTHYRIEEKIGAGGMGEVYRATDTKLGREVAIKVLPEAFAQDPERLARFDQEARLLASLNHPNIAAIHGLEESNGTRFLILELVPGETLAQRIDQGPLPVDEALPLCRQIAEALEAAHERGIIHRDLKPANVKVTPDGKVKVLDFGLAKAFQTDSGAAVDLSQSPTASYRATSDGVILGTAAYMSPEQARGKPVDKRTDIWSFGCVLYECLTGKQAFRGETASDTSAAILRGEPDWGLLPGSTPRAARRLLRRCLTKDLRERLQHIGDARIEIEDALGQAEQQTELAEAERSTWRRPLWILAAASLLVAVFLAGRLTLQRAPETGDGEVRRLSVQLPPQIPLKFNSEQLDVIEDLSESLANDMLDLALAVRERDKEQLRAFVPGSLSATPWPALAQPLMPEVKWVARHGWKVPPAILTLNGEGARPVSGEEFTRGWFALLDHFREIEDARFKVKDATFDPSADLVAGAKVPTAEAGSIGQAKLSFLLVGRDTQGRREWLHGSAEIGVRRGERRWQFQRFNLASVESLVSTRELFSEVALLAGVEVRLPPYGSPGQHLSMFAWNGAAAGDFNNDGWIDLFVTAPRRHYLYLNNGDGTFRDATSEAGLEGLHRGVAPLALDYDNDGDKDVFISAVGRQMLLENRLVPEGKLGFRDISVPSGVAAPAIGISATAGDVNADGYPDIYVTSYNNFDAYMVAHPELYVVSDDILEYETVAELLDPSPATFNSPYQATNGTPNLLFINQRDGTFREEAERWGVADSRWSYSAQFADVNGDKRLDLYVANDAGENGLYIHRGDRFVDEAVPRGVLDRGYGMGVSFADYNNDGLLDLHVTNMSSTTGNRILGRAFPNASPDQNVFVKIAAGSSLYKNTGNGYFRDVTTEAGPFPHGWAWGGGFFDFDNDGWEDIYTPNGYISGNLMKDT